MENTKPKPQDPVLPTLPSLFIFLSTISPFLLVLIFVFISIINSIIKGLIYLFGVIILFFITYVFQLTLHKSDDSSLHNCTIVQFPLQLYSNPSFNSALFLFTIAYISIPMILKDSVNLPLMVVLLCIFAIDTTVRNMYQCTSPVGTVLGGILGIVWGIAWYLLIQTSAPNLLFYDDLISNRVACSRPTEQKFKCAVYKNGELLRTL
jgi:hypothetical protein